MNLLISSSQQQRPLRIPLKRSSDISPRHQRACLRLGTSSTIFASRMIPRSLIPQIDLLCWRVKSPVVSARIWPILVIFLMNVFDICHQFPIRPLQLSLRMQQLASTWSGLEKSSRSTSRACISTRINGRDLMSSCQKGLTPRTHFRWHLMAKNAKLWLFVPFWAESVSASGKHLQIWIWELWQCICHSSLTSNLSIKRLIQIPINCLWLR